MNIYLSKKSKIIIGTVVGVLLLAGIIGGSIAIAKAVKRDKQAKCEHIYNAGEIQTEATCEAVGMILYTCESCDHQKTEEISAKGHVEMVVEAVAATCTEKGFTDGVKCSACEKYLVTPSETPALGHKITALKAISATCINPGKTEGAICARCNAVQEAQEVIPAKGHTIVELKGQAPTCLEVGKTTGSACSDCGKVYSMQEVIPALGHTDANGDKICDVCEQTDIPASMVWQLCTDVSELKVGDQIIIVAKSEDMAMGTTQNASNRGAVCLSKDGNEVTFTESVQVIILEEGTVSNTFALNVGTGYLYAPSSSSNHLKTHAIIDNNSSWQITINENGVAKLIAQGSSTKNMLMYNGTSKLFSCYGIEQESIAIYKLVARESQELKAS